MNRLLFVLVVLVFAGCAFRSDYYQGRRALGEENYDEAIVLFQKALETFPEEPRILADLGVAHFKKGALQEATEYLEEAKSLDPTYGKPYLYLGMAYEKQDDFQKAISEYDAYYRQFPLTPMGRRLKARARAIIRKQITEEIRVAIQQEKSLSVEGIPTNTIAVWYFSNLTGKEEFDMLRKGLADMLITDLSQVGSLKVVERVRLQILMEELKLGESAAIDSSTAPRFGRLLGAFRIVNGGLAMPQEDLFRMDAFCTNVTAGETDAQADTTGSADRFFQMEKELVFGILDGLDVTPTQEERDAIQKIPTESLAAFLAYCRGLDYEDRGMYDSAAGEFQEAVTIDSDFAVANEKLQEVQVLVEAPAIGLTDETAQLEQAVIEVETLVEELGLSAADRLASVDQNSSEGFLIESETTTTDERTSPQQQTTTILNITVDW